MRWCRDTVHSDYLEATASFIAMRLLTVAGAAQVAFDARSSACTSDPVSRFS
jgi:hypothetical protein